MTLHWWMHWFWVTAQVAGLLASPMPSTTQDPRRQGSLVNEASAEVSKVVRDPGTMDPRVVYNGSLLGAAPSSGPPDYDDHEQAKARVLSATGSSFRVAKAISSHTTSKTNSALANNNPQVNEEPSEDSTTRPVPTDNSTRNPIRSPINPPRTRAGPSNMIKRDDPSLDDSAAGSIEPDSRVTWLLTTSKTPERRKKKIDHSNGRSDDAVKNFSKSQRDEDQDLTVLPLRIEGARFKIVVNRTRTITAGNGDSFSTRTFNGSEDIEIDQELAEPGLSATAASILQDFLTAGISESTRLSRARNAFTSDFQRDNREEDRSSDIDVNQLLAKADESVNREIEAPSSPSVVDIAAITGSCLATIVLLSTMGSLGFIMYRRKYLNPPQTLNSDKCSNPDSSGYIDDSTIRDNSEEMYSLDNDSFLNSLEAMTIQNYWTDSVKHTKL